MNNHKESVKILEECIELQIRKSEDYQNPNSNIVQSMHYRRGVDTIFDMMHQKMLRIQSLLEAGSVPKNESLEDSAKDLINYSSFFVAYLRGKMEGQRGDRDAFNRPKSPLAATSYTSYKVDTHVFPSAQSYAPQEEGVGC